MVSSALVRREDIGCKLDNVVTRRYFEIFTNKHLKTVSNGGHVCFTPKEARKAQTIVDNINNLGPFVRSRQAAREIGCGYQSICSLLTSHGSEHLLTDPIGRKPKISYKYDPKHKSTQATIPYVRWSKGALVFFTQNTVDQIAEAWGVLKSNNLDYKDPYINIRLSEPLIRSFFFSAKEVSERTNLPIEFIEGAMDITQKRGLFKGHLWNGLTEPYYLARQQYSNFLERLKKLQGIGLHSPVQISQELQLPLEFVSETFEEFSRAGMYKGQLIKGIAYPYHFSGNHEDVSEKLTQIHKADFVDLEEAVERIGVGLHRFRDIVARNGVRIPVTGELNGELQLRYKRNENGQPRLILPYVQWYDRAKVLFSGTAVLKLTEGMNRLRQLEQHEQKGLESRIAETLLMQDAYSPKKICKTKGLSLQFVQAAMDVTYQAGLLKRGFWIGSINHYYIERNHFGNFSKRLDKLKKLGLTSADQISKRLNLPSDFVRETLDNFYQSGMFRGKLLQGRLCPHYVTQEGVKEVSKKIKEIHSANLLTVSEAIKQTDLEYVVLRNLVCNHGVQNSFTDKIDSTVHVGYKVSPREYPEPQVPFYRWFEKSDCLIPRHVALAIKDARDSLGSINQDKDDAYNYYRLAETFLMKKAYSAREVSEKLNIPLEIILTVMEESYSEGEFIDDLWIGLINPYYISKRQFGNFSRKFKKIETQGLYTSTQLADMLDIPLESVNEIMSNFHGWGMFTGFLWEGENKYFVEKSQSSELTKQIKRYRNSYSIKDLAHRFDLEQRLVTHIVKSLRNQPGYGGIFQDKSKTLHVPKELIDGFPSRDRPLRRIRLAEQKVKDTLPLREFLETERQKRAGHLIGFVDISDRFELSPHLTSRRLRWLANNGYQQQIPMSYIGRLYMSPDLMEQDPFAASIISDKHRQNRYYTDLELQEKFPQLSLYRVRAILGQFQTRFEGRIKEAYGNRIFVEKALIDGRSPLRTYMTKHNTVAQYTSRYIRLTDLQPFSSLGDRALRDRVKEVSHRYKTALVLASNNWWIELKKLRKDANFRDDLSVRAIPPPQTEAPEKIRDLVYGMASAADIIVNRVHRDHVPSYARPYLEYVIHDIGSSAINRKLGQKFEQITHNTDTFGVLGVLYDLICSRTPPDQRQRLLLLNLKVRLNRYYSKK